MPQSITQDRAYAAAIVRTGDVVSGATTGGLGMIITITTIIITTLDGVGID